jgi:hypothetical protein
MSRSGPQLPPSLLGDVAGDFPYPLSRRALISRPTRRSLSRVVTYVARCVGGARRDCAIASAGVRNASSISIATPKRRSMMAAKIGWILATGAHPKGQVTAIGGRG